jgi:uncharacterized protein (TIGR00645 family)
MVPGRESDMHAVLDKVMLASRHLLVMFYLGLVAGLVLFAVRFVMKLGKLAGDLFHTEDNDLLLAMLHLVDSALVASLVLMVALSSYDNFVSRLTEDAKEKKIEWVSSIDPGNLKIKVATAIIAISSIHLLQIFLKVEGYEERHVFWAVAIHGMFLLGALALGLLDRLTAGAPKETKL